MIGLAARAVGPARVCARRLRRYFFGIVRDIFSGVFAYRSCVRSVSSSLVSVDAGGLSRGRNE
jgi:hypothetical protein